MNDHLTNASSLHHDIETKIAAMLQDPSIIALRNTVFHQFNVNREKILQRTDLQALADEVHQIKQAAIQEIEALIPIAIEKFTENDVHVVYAKTAEAARDAALEVIQDDPLVVQSSSDVPVEIDLDLELENRGIQLITTETYCRIFQLASNKIGLHKGVPLRYASPEDWGQILQDQGLLHNPDEKALKDPQYLANQLMVHIHDSIKSARVGITGANAIAAQDGAILHTHSLGNLNYVAQRPVHLIMAGIEKIVPNLISAWKTSYLEMLYSSGLGGATYQLMVRGPSWPTMVGDHLTSAHLGTKEVHVILVDNGRTQMIQEGFEQLLYCIRCFTCHNYCPPYIALGPGIGYDFRVPGFGYKGYIGGRGTLFNYFTSGEAESVTSGLYKCTLCGACLHHCPMQIDIPRLTQDLRHKILSKP